MARPRAPTAGAGAGAGAGGAWLGIHGVGSLVQVMIVTAATCMYLFYVITYMAQLNPLMAPALKTDYVYLKEE